MFKVPIMPIAIHINDRPRFSIVSSRTKPILKLHLTITMSPSVNTIDFNSTKPDILSFVQFFHPQNGHVLEGRFDLRKSSAHAFASWRCLIEIEHSYFIE